MTARIPEDYRRAREVRKLLADVYGAAPEDAVFLAPGTLIGLRGILGSLRIGRLALSAGEYFDRSCFPTSRVELVKVEALLAHVVQTRPDAVLLSVVTWKGARLPLEALFADIRMRLGSAAPLLVADFSHAGAAGFPKVTETGADIVMGDATKWITPPESPDRLGYVWFRTEGHRSLAGQVFAPFYLAGVKPRAELEARWVDPEAVRRIAEFCASSKVTRTRLVARHKADLALAERVAERCGAAHPTSPLVWLSSAAALKNVPKWLQHESLLWRAPGGGVRVTCRSDLAP